MWQRPTYLSCFFLCVVLAHETAFAFQTYSSTSRPSFRLNAQSNNNNNEESRRSMIASVAAKAALVVSVATTGLNGFQQEAQAAPPIAIIAEE